MAGRPVDFWTNVRIADGEGCWEWTLGRNPKGYGRVKRGGKTHQAHRVAYSLTHGDIPAGLIVCHRCDNPPCCNPAHLFVGTHTDNAHDRDSKGRQASRAGRKNGNAKLTEAVVLAIRHDFARGMLSKDVAAKYGISTSVALTVKRGEAWPHVGGPTSRDTLGGNRHINTARARRLECFDA